MKIRLRLHDGRERTAQLPYEGADHVLVKTAQCECSRDLPLQVAGGAQTTHDGGRRVTAPAACTRCHGSVGTLIVQFDGSLFGPEEDARVLSGRCRVY